MVLKMTRLNPKLMVLFVSNDGARPFWLHPLEMQEQFDKEKFKNRLLYDSLVSEIGVTQLRVAEIDFLRVDEQDPFGWSRARRRFAKEKNCQPHPWHSDRFLVKGEISNSP